MTRWTLVGAGLGLIVLGYLAYIPFSSRPDFEQRIRSVEDAILTDVQLQVLDENKILTDRILAGSSRPQLFSVTGAFDGPYAFDFQELAWFNQFFRLEIYYGNRQIWYTSPGRLNVTPGNRFSFDCPIMLPNYIPSGDYRLQCMYGSEVIVTKMIKIDNH